MTTTAQLETAVLHRRGLVVLLLLSLAGLGASVHLSLLHWQVYNVPGHVSFCAINDTVNCDTVAQSRYSLIGGLPLAYWGVMFYGVLAVLLAWGLTWRRSAWPWGLVSLLNWGAVCVSGYYLLVSELIIHSFCIMCIAIYVTNFLMAIVLGRGLWRMGCSLRALANGFFFAALAVAVAFGAVFHTEVRPPRLLAILAAVTVAIAFIAVNFRIRRPLRELHALLSVATRDIKYLLQRPALSGGLLFCGLGVLATTMAVTPRLYVGAQPAVEASAALTALGIGALGRKRSDKHKIDLALIAGGLNGVRHGLTTDGLHWIGAEAPKIVITEYSDYECPFCRKAHEIVRQLVREHKDKVRLIHVQMPLDNTCNPKLARPFHRHACDGALAAICAGQQGAFWPMNDQLFVQQCRFDHEGLVELAGSLGLDKPAFTRCMKSDMAQRALQDNLALCAQKRLKPATPIFSIGSQLVVGLKDKNWWLRAMNRLDRQATSTGT